jgi:hypothetical protein
MINVNRLNHDIASRDFVSRPEGFENHAFNIKLQISPSHFTQSVQKDLSCFTVRFHSLAKEKAANRIASAS